MDESRVYEACANLRFAEGLRRRSQEARAESAVREAAALALLEGARIPPRELRVAAHAFDTESRAAGPDWAVALGAWKAAWTVTETLPPLNSRPRAEANLSWRQLLAGIQRDYGSFLASAGLVDARAVTIPKDPARWGATLAVLQNDGRSALGTAALTWALLMIEEPFAAGSQIMGVLAAKWVLASRGVEPTGTIVLSALAAEKRTEYEAALNAFREGNSSPWEDFFGRSVIRGAQVGQLIARQVQAGTFE